MAWTTVWTVHPRGDQLVEYSASYTERTATVRPPGATKGGQQWGRQAFDQQFADTRLGAIDKWLAMHRAGLAELHRELRETEARLMQLEALRAAEEQS